MSAPPVPPRPYDAPPPPLPPLPPNILERYDSPLIAPKPHNPANMARALDDQLPSRPPWPSPPPSINNVARSMANLGFQYKQPSSPTLPSLTAPLPNIAQLQSAASIIQSPTHDPTLKVAWCRDVFFLIDLAQRNSVPGADPLIGPVTITDPVLSRLAQLAVSLVLQLSQSHNPTQGKIPPFIAEAISMRANLAATGAFPDFIRHNPRGAFRDFESAARGGFAAAWFRLGRDYENFNDHLHARDCFERGVRLNVESCLYRMGMAHLLGQLSLSPNPTVALPLLHRAATLATLQVPQPAYVYALLLLSEFTQITVPPTFFAPLIPPSSSPTLEARKHLERAAFLHFPAAQYKLGHAYEFAEPPFPFDPLLSVQYYSLASEQGEAEADMALSKWFLCGSGGAAGGAGPGPGAVGAGAFDKDESLALTFADKAAKQGLPSAEFAMGYYAEVGVGRPKDIKAALGWYQLAHEHGNPDATARLSALSAPSGQSLSRQEHDTITEVKLVRKRTLAAQRSENQLQSPPWDGTSFPTMGEAQAAAPIPVDSRTVLEGIKKNSLAPPTYDPPQSINQPPPPTLPQFKRYTLSDTTAHPSPVPNSGSGATSPNRLAPAMTPPGGARPSSPARKLRKSNEHSSSSSSIASTNTPSASGSGAGNTRPKLNLDEMGPVPTLPGSKAPPGADAGPGDDLSGGGAAPAPSPSSGKYPTTFAEMGFHGAKVEEKECIIM